MPSWVVPVWQGVTRTPSGVAAATGRDRALVGRRHELAWALDVLAHAHLVTVTGPGGVGKSRFAREVVTRVANGSAGPAVPFDEAVVVELDTVSDPALVADVVAAVLGQQGAHPAAIVADRALAGQTTLLVLDGCDGLVDEVGVLADAMLQACASLRVLVTCRQVLHVGNEHVLRLDPLAVPPDRPLGVDAVLGYEAVAFFVAAALRSCPELHVDAAGADALARICRAVGGLPLALELVAPRLQTLSVGELADAVEAEMAGVEHPARAECQRRTLDRTVAWTFGSLSDGERRALELLSVFVGGAHVEAIMAVSHAGGGRSKLVTALCGLADRSVVTTTMANSGARFDLVGAVRGRVRADLARQGRLSSLARRQLQWCVEVVGDAEEALVTGSGQRRWLELLAAEGGNVRAGLRFALDTGDVEAAASLGCGLWRFWELRGQLAEGRRWLGHILAMEGIAPGRRARLFDGMGMLAWRQGDYHGADHALEQALALAEGCGERRLAARVVNHRGLVALFGGNVGAAATLFERSRAALERLDEPGEAALASANLGLVAITEGRVRDASRLLDATLAVQVALGDRHGEAVTRLHRAIASYYLGDCSCSIGDGHAAAVAFAELGDERSLGFSLLVLSAAFAGDRPSLSLELWGLATAVQQRVGVTLPVGWPERVEAALAPARAAVGPQADEVTERGAAMEPAVALAKVRAAAHRHSSMAPDEPSSVLEGGPHPSMAPDEASQSSAVGPHPSTLPDGAGRPWTSVQTLGGFEVCRHGQPLRLAPQVGRLVKVVAANGRRAQVEQVIEALWPEVHPDIGRRRLRNVLARLHREVGPVVLRRGEELAFAPGVVIDLDAFEASARRVLAELADGQRGPATRRQARQAVQRYGAFLPDEPYEPWAAATRERLERIRLRLLDSWADVSATDGDFDDAEMCLRMAIEADPTDERRYLLLARLLVRVERPVAASAVLARARAMADDLGVRVSPALTALEATLSARSPSTATSPSTAST